MAEFHAPGTNTILEREWDGMRTRSRECRELKETTWKEGHAGVRSSLGSPMEAELELSTLKRLVAMSLVPVRHAR